MSVASIGCTVCTSRAHRQWHRDRLVVGSYLKGSLC